jgi:hypothetical protein
LTDFYDKELDSEEKAFFLEVDFNKYKSEEAIKAEIDRL